MAAASFTSAREPLTKSGPRFFPGVPEQERNSFGYPQPLTNPFWEMYAEPLSDFFPRLTRRLSNERTEIRTLLQRMHVL
jgi:hypothetical protein